MRKPIAIFLIFLFSAATTELGQLLKIPVLVHHYLKHQREDAMSFTAFMAEHYMGNHEDEDKRDDMQLPFKSPMGNPSFTASISMEPIELTKPQPEPPELFIPLRTSFVPSQIFFQVFHPPRTV